jgi:hypothetical protein
MNEAPVGVVLRRRRASLASFLPLLQAKP